MQISYSKCRISRFITTSKTESQSHERPILDNFQSLDFSDIERASLRESELEREREREREREMRKQYLRKSKLEVEPAPKIADGVTGISARLETVVSKRRCRKNVTVMSINSINWQEGVEVSPFGVGTNYRQKSI